MHVQNVCVELNKKRILNSVDLKINEGTILALLGQNGVGKTTLLKAILGLVKIETGEIKIDSNKRIGFLIDTPTFFDDQTGFDNLYYYAQIMNYSKEAVLKAMEKVGLTNSNLKVRQYSLGMKQRLALARAFVGEPNILLLDEPINGLDPVGVYEIRKLLLDLNKKQNVTIILASHLIHELELMSKEYAVIQNGEIVASFNKENAKEIFRCIEIRGYMHEVNLDVLKGKYPHLLYIISGEILKIFTQPQYIAEFEEACKNLEAIFKKKSGFKIRNDVELEEYYLALMILAGGV